MANKILIVGGTFDRSQGKPSGLISKLSKCIIDLTKDYVINVVNGGNIEELKEKISSLYNNKQKTDEYSRNCKDIDFDDIEQYYEKIIKYYK